MSAGSTDSTDFVADLERKLDTVLTRLDAIAARLDSVAARLDAWTGELDQMRRDMRRRS